MREQLAQVINLKAAYGESVVLDGISLEVYPGEILAIIGGSGSGKTTLLKHFIGLLRPIAGRVELFGSDWQELDEADRESTLKRIGVMFQNGALLGSKSLATNIAIPIEQHTELPQSVINRVVSLKLHQVGLDGAEQRMPSELSGGMRKRASLARALVLDPQLLFCDEPSAGLDPVTSYQLDQLLLQLRAEHGLSIVVVTHEIASIKRIADRVAYLEHGKMLFNGTLVEALSSKIESVKQFFKTGSLE